MEWMVWIIIYFELTAHLLCTCFVDIKYYKQKYKMVMHRALFTWFILLLFFILLCLRLEGRIHWNWFLIFLPMWIYDLILSIDSVFHLFICRCRTKNLYKSKELFSFISVVLLIIGKTILGLHLEYKFLQLKLVHVLIPFWILLVIIIGNTTCKLFKNRYW